MNAGIRPITVISMPTVPTQREVTHVHATLAILGMQSKMEVAAQVELGKKFKATLLF